MVESWLLSVVLTRVVILQHTLNREVCCPSLKMQMIASLYMQTASDCFRVCRRHDDGVVVTLKARSAY